MSLTQSDVLERILTEDHGTDFSADLIIVGGGPAAITASQYAVRDGLSVMIFDPRELARKVALHDVYYLPGCEEVVHGPELAAHFRKQMKCQVIPQMVEKVLPRLPRRHAVYSENGIYYARAVLIATGLRKREMGLLDEEEFRSRGVFVYLDAIPNTQCIKDVVEFDQHGFIRTAETLMTSTPGIFAAGDVRSKYLRQVITAVADGATAAMAIVNYLRE
jgi:thioredoxin reductase